MFVFTSSIDNVVMHISNISIDEGDRYKVSDNLYISKDNNLLVFEIDSMGKGIVSGQYCYTPEEGFYINPNWAEPMNLEQEVKTLKAQNEELYEFTAELLMNQCSDELGINGEEVI